MKKNKKGHIKTLLYPIYCNINNRLWKHRMRRKLLSWNNEDQIRFDFLSQFITADDIVFDVGANLGNRAKVFHRLGAVVIAIEPQDKCSEVLRSVFKGKSSFCIEEKALGAAVGHAEIQICNEHTISSLSPDWIRSVKESGRFAEYEWKTKESVPVDTLDNLIAKYGYPAFIKIDVEGYEEHVVSRLSHPVKTLSFEFTPEFMNSTVRCIEYLCRIAEWKFQISLGESMVFSLPQWVTASQVKRALIELPKNVFGDVYARLSG